MAVFGPHIDWSGCELVERIPGKVSGRAIVRGTRILPDGIVSGHAMGESVEDLHEGFPALSVLQIRQLLEFATVQAAYRSKP